MIDFEQLAAEGALAPVGEFGSLAEANEYALVVLAMNLDCWIHLDAERRRYQIYADPAFAVAIRDEFALYRAEQEEGPGRAAEIPAFKSGIELVLLWALVLLLVFAKQGEDPSLAKRFCSSSVALIDQGEWWRPFTSLFLHGDLGHLLSNVLLGGIFCVFVAHTMGPLLGWAMILASGVLGNVATSWAYYPEEFRSLGASTATFGALGILVGAGALLAWQARSLRRIGGALVPIVAGSIVLGWWGAGGDNTDVAGHVAGFLAGALLGAVGILVRAWRSRSRLA